MSRANDEEKLPVELLWDLTPLELADITRHLVPATGNQPERDEQIATVLGVLMVKVAHEFRYQIGQLRVGSKGHDDQLNADHLKILPVWDRLLNRPHLILEVSIRGSLTGIAEQVGFRLPTKEPWGRAHRALDRLFDERIGALWEDSDDFSYGGLTSDWEPFVEEFDNPAEQDWSEPAAPELLNPVRTYHGNAYLKMTALLPPGFVLTATVQRVFAQIIRDSL